MALKKAAKEGNVYSRTLTAVVAALYFYHRKPIIAND